LEVGFSFWLVDVGDVLSSPSAHSAPSGDLTFEKCTLLFAGLRFQDVHMQYACELGLTRIRNSFHSYFCCVALHWARLIRRSPSGSHFDSTASACATRTLTCALLGFFSMKNPSLCCKVTFCLRVTLQQSGLACHRQAKP
jgi:hypothetical protein